MDWAKSPFTEDQQRREVVRNQAVLAVIGGQTQAEVARLHGVHPDSVHRWMKEYRRGGFVALSSKVLGPRIRAPMPKVAKDDPRLQHWKSEKEKRRRQSVAAVLGGMPQNEAAQKYGVTPSSVCRWVQMVRIGGPAALAPKGRGLRQPLHIAGEADPNLREILGEENLKALCLKALQAGLTPHQAGSAFAVARATIHEWSEMAPSQELLPFSTEPTSPKPYHLSSFGFTSAQLFALKIRCVLSVKEGLTQPEAGLAFGVCRGAVAKWVSLAKRGGAEALAEKPRPKRPRRPAPKYRKRDARKKSPAQIQKMKNQLVAWIGEGMTMTTAAGKLGIHPSTAFRWMKRYRSGLTPPS